MNPKLAPSSHRPAISLPIGTRVVPLLAVYAPPAREWSLCPPLGTQRHPTLRMRKPQSLKGLHWQGYAILPDMFPPKRPHLSSIQVVSPRGLSSTKTFSLCTQKYFFYCLRYNSQLACQMFKVPCQLFSLLYFIAVHQEGDSNNVQMLQSIKNEYSS